MNQPCDVGPVGPKRPLNILFEGWINVPHSYAIVLCFQLIALQKNYGHLMVIYVREMPYFNPKWVRKDLLYGPEYNKILESFKEPGQDVPIDLIYRITFPYNISISNDNIGVPKCVFYTSEFAVLGPDYFSRNGSPIKSLDFIKTYVNQFKNLYFTSPSIWSAAGLKDYVDDARNKIITHGTDTKLYYYDRSNRSTIRTRYGVSDTDVLMLNMGAFTSNKGILLLLQLINILVNRQGHRRYKIMFKGLQDLYDANSMFNVYFEQLKDFISPAEKQSLITNGHLLFINNTMTFAEMKDMYNACDLYVSPYIAEGFNLTPLEALACGTRTLVPRTGSTKEYIDDIYANGGSKHIYYIDSKAIVQENRYINDISFNSLYQTVLSFNPDEFGLDCHRNDMIAYINKMYSWDHVSGLLYNYFIDIIGDNNRDNL
jgi:glycosyltransferase involved in cell wall biosynthesis